MKRFGQILRELWRDPMGRIGMLGIFLVILMAVFAPQLSHFGPEKMVGLPKAPPSSEFWFGTDNYGRDIFSRILYGARVSLQVGIIAVGIAATAGYVLGLIAGYFEGWVDRVIMCVMDIFFAFPSILLAIFISAVLGRGLVNTMIAIGIVNIPVFARTVRASVISAKGLEYVQNAKSVGVRTGAILIRHISPNVVAPFTVQATLALSSAILTEASMSFLAWASNRRTLPGAPCCLKRGPLWNRPPGWPFFPLSLSSSPSFSSISWATASAMCWTPS